MSRLWRSGKLFVLVGSLFGSFVVSPSAVASTNFIPGYDFARYSPTEGSLVIERSNSTYYEDDFYIDQHFLWSSDRRITGLRNSDNDSYEHEVNFRGGRCFPRTSPYEPDNNNYYGRNFYTNMPSAYVDTAYRDDETLTKSRAAGSGDSHPYVVGKDYFWSYFVTHACLTDSDIRAVGLKITAQDSFRNGACVPTDAYCVTGHAGGKNDIVPYSAGWYAYRGLTYNWRMNRNHNESFESGGGAWATAAAAGAPYGVNSQVLYDQGAYEGRAHARFNCAGTPGCKMYQRSGVALRSNGIMRNEVSLRCLSAYTSCPVRLAIVAYGITTQEAQAISISVPGDGNWHYYKLGARYFNSHDLAEWAIYSDHASQHVEVDMTTLHWTDDQ